MGLSPMLVCMLACISYEKCFSHFIRSHYLMLDSSENLSPPVLCLSPVLGSLQNASAVRLSLTVSRDYSYPVSWHQRIIILCTGGPYSEVVPDRLARAGRPLDQMQRFCTLRHNSPQYAAAEMSPVGAIIQELDNTEGAWYAPILLPERPEVARISGRSSLGNNMGASEN